MDENTFVNDVGQVREQLFKRLQRWRGERDAAGGRDPGHSGQAVAKAARESLIADLEVLRQNRLFQRVGLTGSAFVREGQLDATTKSLQTSSPIAAAAPLALLLITLRSLRSAVVTVIPVGLVVAWLYALMYLIGFSLNAVTATIGAISMGLGSTTPST